MVAGAVHIFTDASHVRGEEGTWTTAYAWLALDAHLEDSFVVPRVAIMEEFSHSVAHAEVLAALDAVAAYREAPSITVFTDSLLLVDQVTREREGIERRSRIYRDEITALAELPSVTLHHVRAHSGFFYNEVADKMAKQVAMGLLTPQEAEAWGRQVCRRGVLEIPFTKNPAFQPRRVRRHGRKTLELRARAREGLLTS